MKNNCLLSSNINILESNEVWDKNVIRKNIVFDEYNRLMISLNDKKTLSSYNKFICIIYLNDYFENNFKKIFNQLENTLSKNKNKNITLFLFLKKTNNIIIDKEYLIQTNIFVNRILKLSSENFKLIFNLNEKKEFFSTRNKFLLRCPFSAEGLSSISKQVSQIPEEKLFKPFKLLILDCDNTLWGGTIGEDGVESIKYSEDGEGKIFEKIQKHFKKLKKMGFMLSICSKNNSRDVWNAFRLRNMHLKKNDFLFPKINWEEKAKNINEILNAFSLREHDVLFIDDQKIEIDKVKKKFKNISTLHVNDLSQYYEDILALKRLQKFEISNEDKKKHNSYKLKKKYQEFKEAKNNFDEIFTELNQKISFIDIKKSNILRTEQLFNKTNQFNFTTNRYNKDELLMLSKNNASKIKLISLQDKFGNHGVIGCVHYKKINNEVYIQDFILSCRILSRKIEEYIVFIIKKKFKNNNVYLEYIKNDQNKDLISIFLKKNYFKLQKEKKKKTNKFLYKIFYNKELNEIKKFF